MPSHNIPITIAYGDGVGPEVMEAVLMVLQEARAPVHFEIIEIGARMYERGHTAGVASDGWESILRTRVLLKGPLLPPPPSLRNKPFDTMLVQSLGLFARITPIRAYAPAVASKHPKTDLVVIQDGEDSGIEHRVSEDVYQSLRITSAVGLERLIRLGLRYARTHEKSKVHGVLPGRALPLTGGLMETRFARLAEDEDGIAARTASLPELAAMLFREPEALDVVIGDEAAGEVLVAVASEICGAETMSATACLGESAAMFEPLHGAMVEEAGTNTANPSGMLMAAVQMLDYLDLPEQAALIHNAWLRTLEDGAHPKAIFHPPVSVAEVGTREFAEAMVRNFGREPSRLPVARYARQDKARKAGTKRAKPAERELLGVDVFIHAPNITPEALGNKADRITPEGVKLRMICQRGLKVWPGPARGQTVPGELWRCRFVAHNERNVIAPEQIVTLLKQAGQVGLEVVKTENLYTFNGELGYTLALGE